MPRLFLVLALALIAGCENDADQAVRQDSEAVRPDSAAESAETGSMETAVDQRRALNTALDTLEALVATLERVQDPIGAWNRAADVARLLAELERTRPAYALDMDEDEAARRYPDEIDRLNRLEARRDIEMNRIMEDRVIAQVLLEEMTQAEQEAASGDTTGTAD